MSLVLLPNTYGAIATSLLVEVTLHTIIQGSLDRIVSGGRQDFMSAMTNVSSSNMSFRYGAAAAPWTHMVAARYDRLKYPVSSVLTPVVRANSGSGMADVAGSFDYDIGFDYFAAGRGQDMVFTADTPRTVDVAAELRLNHTSGDALSKQISKLYVSNAFSFGVEPEFIDEPTWQEMSDGGKTFKPLHGWMSYPVVADLTVTWRDVTRAKVAEFMAIKHLLRWPLFLYDDEAAIFPWKLEHVLVSTYSVECSSPDFATVTVTFLRLEHYR